MNNNRLEEDMLYLNSYSLEYKQGLYIMQKMDKLIGKPTVLEVFSYSILELHKLINSILGG